MSASDYAFTYNGLTLSRANGYLIFQAPGLNAPPIRISEANLTGLDGGTVWNTLYGMRTIALEGRFFADSTEAYEAKRRELLGAFVRNPTDRTLTIVMPSGTTRTIQAYVTVAPEIIDKAGRLQFNEFRIELRCPDVFFSSVATNTYSATLVQSGGNPVPAPVPSPILSGNENQMLVSNTGDLAQYPVVTFRGAINSPTLTNLTTGKSFQINYSLVGGEYITVQKTSTGLSVLKNGSIDLFSYFSGEFFPIIVGSNDVRLGSGAYVAGGSVELSITDAYLSV